MSKVYNHKGKPLEGGQATWARIPFSIEAHKQITIASGNK